MRQTIMSYNTALLFQRTHRGKGKAHYFGGLGLPGGKEAGEVSFDDACDPGLAGKALAVIGDWTVVIDQAAFAEVANHPSVKEPGLFPIVLESRLLHSTRKAPALGAMMVGASRTYGFIYFAEGERKRLALRTEGQLVWDLGVSSFPSDTFSIEDCGESAVLGVIYEATGLSAVDLESASYSLFKFDEKHIRWVHE